MVYDGKMKQRIPTGLNYGIGILVLLLLPILLLSQPFPEDEAGPYLTEIDLLRPLTHLSLEAHSPDPTDLTKAMQDTINSFCGKTLKVLHVPVAGIFPNRTIGEEEEWYVSGEDRCAIQYGIPGEVVSSGTAPLYRGEPAALLVTIVKRGELTIEYHLAIPFNRPMPSVLPGDTVHFLMDVSAIRMLDPQTGPLFVCGKLRSLTIPHPE